MKVIYTLSGQVIPGKNRGKSLGFPTANIVLKKIIPEGIYASKVILDDKEYLAATFIGTAKTFNESEFKAESHIMDFDKDIYGQSIKIKLYNKIRNNKKFSSKEELIFQMKSDVEEIKKILKEKSKHGITRS